MKLVLRPLCNYIHNKSCYNWIRTRSGDPVTNIFSAVKLIKSYLCDRTQQVQFNNTTSSPGLMKYRVPQGSILGPILFLIYDMPLYTTNTEIDMYAADDATFHTANKDPKIIGP